MILRRFLRAQPPADLPSIVVLTPIKDIQEQARPYFNRLRGLTYPAQRISIALLESDSRDGTYESFRREGNRVQTHFRSVQIWQHPFAYQIPQNVPRWQPEIQAHRRTVLARSRNHLLSRGLGDADWALWLDADVIEFPPDIIQQLLAFGKDIIHPHCVKKFGGPSFDLNAWRDQGGLCMHDLRDQTPLVELHAVGGTMLLVRADCHRDGLIFPPYLYGPSHPWARGPGSTPMHVTGGEIETEGLALMAKDMNLQCWGAPGLEIRHRDA